MIVTVRDLSYEYPGTKRVACEVPDFSIEHPELVAITGESGAGKSTFVELLAGTLKGDYSGSVRVFGRELRNIRGDHDRQLYLRSVGFVPQDFALLPGTTVGSLLRQDLRDADVSTTQHEARIGHALSQVGLSEFTDAMSHELSGGQRQRVAIARALARGCPLIVADEPTAALDKDNVAAILALLRQLASTCVVLLVTHDPSVAAACDRVIRLKRPRTERPSAKVRGRPVYMVLAAVVPAAALVCLLVLVWAAPPKQTPTSKGHGVTSAGLGAGHTPSPPSQPNAVPTPASPTRAPITPAPTQASPAPVAPSQAPVPNEGTYWACEADESPGGGVNPSSIGSDWIPSQFCQSHMTGLLPGATAYRVPLGNFTPFTTSCGGGVVVNIIDPRDGQVGPQYWPASNEYLFDSNWNLILGGAC